MHLWHGVVTKLTKGRKAAVVKDLHSKQEQLVSFDINALLEIDFDDEALVNASDSAPWANADEQKLVEVGTEVFLTTLVDHFPTRADEVVSMNFRYAVELTSDKTTATVPRGGVVVIYHDFIGDRSSGDSGELFAGSVSAWCKDKLFRPCFLIKADTTLAAVIASLEKLAAEDKKGAVIDTILIVTHGGPGRLYIGNPDDPKDANFIAEAVSGKLYTSAQSFGAKLQSLFGPGLAIGIYSCDFVQNAAGSRLAIELRTSSAARAVYAAKGTVLLMPNKNARPTALCTTSHVVYSGDKIEGYADGQIPIFDI